MNPATHPNPKRPQHPRLAALHHEAGNWHVVVARTDAPGGVSIVHAGTVPNADAVDALLRDQRVGAVVGIIPAAETVCRPAAIPQAPSPGAAAEALGLIAEAELPASIPAHRRAGGIVPPVIEGSPPIPMLIAWPQRADADDPEGPEMSPGAWAPELVCLAALARASGTCVLAVRADRGSGAVAIVAAGPERAAARVLRADTSSAQAWAAAVADSAKRTARAVGLAADGVRGDSALQLLDEDGRPAHISVPGVRNDDAWLAAYGPGAGAILALTGADDAALPLLSMRPDSGDDARGPLARALSWLSSPVRAGAVLAACAAVLLLVPLGVAATRASVLERRAAGQTPLSERLAAADREVAFYDLLRARRWPMTKLLADVAGAAPVGVRLDSIDLAPDGGSAASGLVLRGSAGSADLVTEFTKNLSDTRVFAEIATPSIAPETGGDGVTFQLQARVDSPLFRAKPAADFASQTLARRMYGDRAVEPSGDDGQRTGDRDRDDRAAPADEPPPAPAAPLAPLTDEVIAAMDRVTALKETGLRRTAAMRAAEGSPERQRLDDEIARLRAHIARSRGAGGGQ